MKPLNFLYNYYTHASPNPSVLGLCGVEGPDSPYSREIDRDLTVIINGWKRPEYLPLVWEGIQYQRRSPFEIWIVQNDSAATGVPRAFFDMVRTGYRTMIFESPVNAGCWFRFFLAALFCRTKYVAVYDDDTLSGNLALKTALAAMERQPGVYGGRGITLRAAPAGPSFWNYDAYGWPQGTEVVERVDFVGHLWIMETYWLRDLFCHLPEPFLKSVVWHRECGEDMYLSFVAQKRDIATFVYEHGKMCNARWSSIQGKEMGVHRNAMFMSGGLANGDRYLRCLIDKGWRLLRY